MRLATRGGPFLPLSLRFPPVFPVLRAPVLTVPGEHWPGCPVVWSWGSQVPVPNRKWARAASPLNLAPGRKNQCTSVKFIKVS